MNRTAAAVRGDADGGAVLPPVSSASVAAASHRSPPHPSEEMVAAPSLASVTEIDLSGELAVVVADLVAVDPMQLGVLLRARAGPARDAWLDAVRARLAPTALRKIPVNVGVDRLIGGLDLGATLRAGRPVLDRGLLARLDGEIALLVMAERISGETVAQIAAALDTGEVNLERDGLAARLPARFGAIALDESDRADAVGWPQDDGVSPALRDRLAIHLDFTLARTTAMRLAPDLPRLADARRRLAVVTTDDRLLVMLTEVAAALGVASLRAVLFALAVARAAAALAGRNFVAEDDVAAAVTLVLAPRATRVPRAAPREDDAADPDAADDGPRDETDREADAQAEQPPATPPADDPSTAGPQPGVEDQPPDTERPDHGDGMTVEMLVEAAAAALPRGLIDALAAGPVAGPAARGRGLGAAQASTRTGRPIGVRAGLPQAGARVSLIETLKAAAPWQPVRRREDPAGTRLLVRPEDVRVRRFRDRRETVTVFVVDASGSVARTRLAEAKGAVELMLGESYARRDQVALIVLNGRTAALALPPTRSLTRAKRLLAALPGGGGTPLAAGLDLGAALADEVRRKGRTPTLVLLGDCRANVARSGAGDRVTARQEALASARRLRAGGIGCIVIDTARTSGADARALAATAGARYLWLPRADAAAIQTATRSA